MKMLLQRVRQACVHVDEQKVGEIAQGLLVLVGVERLDSMSDVQRLGQKLLNYRVFSDEQGKMNLSVQQIQGGILLVSQFTLAAQTKKGLRPGFSSAAEPQEGRALFDALVAYVQQHHAHDVATGVFGADMQVSLINDGPVTFLLD